MDTNKKTKRNLREAGNAIVMLFAAVGMAGVVGYGLNNVMRGPAMSAAELSKRTIAENNLVATSRMAISTAAQQTDGGDCDRDGFVEPLPYRDAGVNPKPDGGGYLPLSMGASISDPWNTQYGYCVWDQGTLTVTDNVTACGGNTAKRLVGSKRDDQPAIAIISAGKDGVFGKKCRAFVDTTPADGMPDLPLVYEDAPNDDIVLTYTYAEANGIGGGLWKIKSMVDPNDKTTAEIGKNLEVGGGASFGGALALTQKGLILPGDPGDNSVTGACTAAKDQQLRRNTSTNPPSLELCDFAGGSGWVTASGGSSEETCAFDYWRPAAVADNYWLGISGSHDGKTLVATTDGEKIYTSLDRGATWTPRDSNRNWRMVSSSYNGTEMAASVYGGQLYTSTDSGATWFARDSNRNWYGVASSSDGTKLVANVAGGRLYTSVDSGMTWAPQDSSRNWSYVASSADGTKLAATVYTAGTGRIYVSTDSGATWTPHGVSGRWYDVAVSADGTKMAATLEAGNIYTSTDSGTTWTPRESVRNWMMISSSADGETLLATVDNSSTVYLSQDSGVNWEAINIPGAQADLSDTFVTPDGKMLIVGDYGCTGGCLGGKIYTATCNDTGTLKAPTEYRAKVPHPLDVGLVSHWKMDEGTGTTVKDSVGTNDGAFVNSPQWITAVNGTGGVGMQKADRDAIQITGLLGSTTSGTFSGWVNINSVDTVGSSIFSIGGVMTVGYNPTNGLYLSYNDGGTDYLSAGNIVLEGTGWRYVTATFDSVNDFFRIYLDGVLLKEIISAPDLSYAAASANTLIGRDSTANNDLDGGVDDFRFYDRALSPSEVSRLYEREKNSSLQPDLSPIRPKTDSMSGKISLSTYTSNFACGIKTDGSAWCWGDNSNGQLGTTKYASSAVPVLVEHTLAPREWVSISAGGSHLGNTQFACGIKADGSAWCWGRDGNGQLGNGATTSTQFSPSLVSGGYTWSQISAGLGHACGITTGGAGWCWGSDSGGQLGNGAGGSTTSPASIGSDKWIDISAGSGHSCGIKTDGSAWCWGTDTNGKLGNGTGGNSTSPVRVEGGGQWSRISVGGGNHSCGIKTDGSAWCWGWDNLGQLGNGAMLTADQQSPIMVQGGERGWATISVGMVSTCGIKTDGSAWCWGADSGHLGNGAALTANQETPSRVLLPNPVVALSAGGFSTCAMESNGTLWCWGEDGAGELGNGAITGTQHSPTRVVNWPNPAPFLWNDALTSISMNPGTTLALGSKWISDDGTSKYFGFQGKGRAALSQPTGGSQLLVETGAATQSSQVSFRTVPATLVASLGTPTAEWLFDDSSGITVTAAPATFNGTASGSPVWNTTGGYVATSGALEFNANTNPRVTVPRHASLESAVITVAFWMKMEGQQTPGATILSKTHSNNTGAIKESYGFHIEPGNKISFVTGRTGGSDKLISKSTIRPNSWVHVVGVYIPAGNKKALLINGNVDNQATQNSAIAYDTTATGGLYFGSAGCVAMPCQNFHGSLDNVRFYNTAFSAAFVKKMYNDYIMTMATPQTIGIDHGTSNLEIGRNNAAATNFLDTITPDMAITSTGNIGIGSATPQSRVDVAGGVRIGSQEICGASNAGTIRFNKGGYCEDGLATWTPKLTNDVWEGMATSRDGSIIFVGANSGFAQISRDGGETFSQLTDLGSGQWASAAMSGDGKNIYTASNNGGYIYRSTDSGISWSQTASPTGNWLRMAASEDGTRVAVVEWSGYIYTSTDSGQTWTQRDSSRVWAAITMSSDGMRLAAANKNGKIFTSSDGGVNWTSQAGSPTQAWYAMAGTGDGKTLIAAASGGGDLVWRSTDYGVTWAPLATGSADILGLAMSSDGNTMAAAGFGYVMRVSKNAGTAWSNSAVARDWRGVVISRDGRKIVGSEHNGQIHVSNMCADTASQPAYESCDGTSWIKWPPGGSSGFKAARKEGGISTMWVNSCGLKGDGTAWCWGTDSAGAIGNGPTSSVQLTPAAVTGSDTWNIISTGGDFVCGIKIGGTAWCWGVGTDGQIGNGATSSVDIPTQVSGTGTWKKVSAGMAHACGIKNDGTAWCWGGGSSGGLGNGTNTAAQSTPVQVSGTGTWTDISVGGHACGIKTDGTAWCWGTGTDGQLGNSGTLNSNIPVQVTSVGTWKKISSGTGLTCGIMSNGTAWCWGLGGSGQLGNGTNPGTRSFPAQVSGAGTWTDISAGILGACGIKNDGTAWCWGGHFSGRTGVNELFLSTNVPMQVHSDVNSTGWSDWTYISSGSYTTCGQRVDGSSWCWGESQYGSLGDNQSSVDAARPVRVQ